MGEGATLGVLAGEPHRDTVFQKRRVRESLALAPVDAALRDRLVAALELLGQLRVDRERVRNGEELLVQHAQPVGGDSRDDRVARRRGANGIGRDSRRRRGGTDGLPQLLVRRPQRRRDLGDERLGLVGLDRALIDEPGGIDGPHRRLTLDSLDHQGLRVRRVVLLVVPEPPVADQVDHEVVAELGAVGESEAHGRERRLGIVGVDVHDRHVEALGQVARVAGGAALGRVSRVANLVVRDQVERAAGRVALERLQVEGLGNDALPRERCIAVDQDGQRDGGVVDAGADRAVGLLRPGATFDNRVGRLEMARIWDDRDVDLPRRRDARARRRQVVLDVSRAALGVDDERVERALALELAQDRLVRAADCVHERVEPAPVGHPDHDLVCASRGGEPDRLVEHRHERLETLERELLLPQERATQGLLEALGLGEPMRRPCAR